ncbi:MAG: SMP-30/gluconolactonase/LRE family protein, partial [Candidatus Latescibacterota bacterium]
VVTISDPVGVPKLLAEGFSWPEGPSLDKEGNLYVCDSGGNFITKITPFGEKTVAVEVGTPSCCSMFDRDGNFYLANFISHKVLKSDLKTTAAKLLSDRTTDGETLRGPNDMAWDQSGRLYFTDPSGSSDRPIGNVCYIDLDGKTKKFTTGFCYPNGLAFSKDYKSLFIAATNEKVIWRFDVKEDGTAGSKHFFYNMGEDLADGMKVDAEGHLWIACFTANALWRISPEGKLVDKIKMPGEKANSTNICFGGPDMRTAYLTQVDGGNGKVWTMRMPVAGMPQIPEAWIKSK